MANNQKSNAVLDFFRNLWETVKEKVKAKFTPDKKRNVSPLAIFLGVVLALYVLSMVMPLLWVLLTTTKLNREYELFIAADGTLGN